jgi:hypothetical protein
MTEGADAVPRRRRWPWVLLGCVAAVALLAVSGFVYLRSRDSTTVVSVDDALGSFRGSDAAAHTVERRPAPGVYEYDTVGQEHIDSLGGSTHTYPARTTMTYTVTDCGYRTRWDVFEERFDELDRCTPSEGETVDATRQYREFFGFSDDQTFQCDKDVLVRTEPPVFGETRTTPCTADGATAEMRVTVLGVEPVEVGGTSVDGLHIRLETTLAGAVRGSSTLNYWADPVTGLILRQETTVRSDADSPLGVTRYEEDYTVHLVSLIPHQ